MDKAAINWGFGGDIAKQLLGGWIKNFPSEIEAREGWTPGVVAARRKELARILGNTLVGTAALTGGIQGIRGIKELLESRKITEETERRKQVGNEQTKQADSPTVTGNIAESIWEGLAGTVKGVGEGAKDLYRYVMDNKGTGAPPGHAGDVPLTDSPWSRYLAPSAIALSALAGGTLAAPTVKRLFDDAKARQQEQHRDRLKQEFTELLAKQGSFSITEQVMHDSFCKAAGDPPDPLAPEGQTFMNKLLASGVTYATLAALMGGMGGWALAKRHNPLRVDEATIRKALERREMQKPITVGLSSIRGDTPIRRRRLLLAAPELQRRDDEPRTLGDHQSREYADDALNLLKLSSDKREGQKAKKKKEPKPSKMSGIPVENDAPTPAVNPAHVASGDQTGSIDAMTGAVGGMMASAGLGWLKKQAEGAFDPWSVLPKMPEMNYKPTAPVKPSKAPAVPKAIAGALMGQPGTLVGGALSLVDSVKGAIPHVETPNQPFKVAPGTDIDKLLNMARPTASSPQEYVDRYNRRQSYIRRGQGGSAEANPTLYRTFAPQSLVTEPYERYLQQTDTKPQMKLDDTRARGAGDVKQVADESLAEGKAIKDEGVAQITKQVDRVDDMKKQILEKADPVIQLATKFNKGIEWVQGAVSWIGEKLGWAADKAIGLLERHGPEVFNTLAKMLGSRLGGDAAGAPAEAPAPQGPAGATQAPATPKTDYLTQLTAQEQAVAPAAAPAAKDEFIDMSKMIDTPEAPKTPDPLSLITR